MASTVTNGDPEARGHSRNEAAGLQTPEPNRATLPALRILVLGSGIQNLVVPVLVTGLVSLFAPTTLALAAGLATALLLGIVGVLGGWWVARHLESLSAAVDEALRATAPGNVGAASVQRTSASAALDADSQHGPAEVAQIGRAIAALVNQSQATRTADDGEKSMLVERVRRLEAMRDVTTDIVRELDLTTLLETIIRRATELVGGDSGTVSLWNPEAEALELKAVYGMPAWMPVRQLRRGEGAGGQVVERREGLIVNDYRSWQFANPEVIRRTNIVAALVEPIVYQEHLIGVLIIHHEQAGGTFTSSDQEIVRLFAERAALAIRNASLYRAEAEARAAALASDRAKSDLLATMSHEIRTPMNGVIGMTSLLLESDLDARQREYVDTIRMSGEVLLTVIDDILDFSKIEAGKLDIGSRPFDLVTTIDAVVSLLSPRAAERGLILGSQVAPTVPRQVVGDDVRIRQILLNLVGNALKFTERGSIMIDVTAAQTDGSGVTIAVHDTGIGIPRDRLQQMFERYTQIDPSSTQQYGGTGLGLAISRRLVEMMGGEIGANSEPGQGSTFWVTLPLPPAAPHQAASVPPARRLLERRQAPGSGGSVGGEAAQHADPGAPRTVPPATAPVSSCAPPCQPAEAVAATSPLPAQAQRRVLVVEDDPIGQRVTAHLVRRLGYTVDVVPGGQEAIDATAATAYALVLMDCQMPGIDGYMATDAIRRREATAHHRTDAPRRLPIVALTASTLGTDRARSLAAGMDEYLTKPIDERQLAALLARWAGHPHAADSAPEDSGPAAERAPDRVSGDAPDTPPVLDPAGLFGATGQPRPEHREIVELFLQETPRRIDAVRDAARNGDREQVARRAHTLAGSASSLGALRLAAVCSRVERLARAGAPVRAAVDAIDEIPPAVAELERALRRRFPAAEGDQATSVP